MSNPLEHFDRLPPFSDIRPDHAIPALEACLAANRKQLLAQLDANDSSFEGLLVPLMAANERLSRLWSPIRHANSVVSSDALRAEHDKGLPMLSEYWTELGQNTRLFEAVKSIRDSTEFAGLDPAAQRIVIDELRDFRLAGVALPEAEKARYKVISQRLSELSSQFQNNVLDATNAWSQHIEDESELSGLPDSARALLAQNAASKDLQGWLVNLEFPCVHAITTYADNRELRRLVYEAFSTRASDQGPHAGRFDNTALIDETLALRHEKARLVGFDNYAELSVATKMADNADDVVRFLEDLARRAKPAAEKEFAALRVFAADELDIASLEAWDVAYASEKLRQSRYELSQEDLRPYFSAPAVIAGLFAVAERLYGVNIEARSAVDVWHPDVTFYDVMDVDGELIASFYLDPYAREHKRGGAWMDECVTRMEVNGSLDKPVAYLTCNFTPPVGDDPALLTHDEVITLFHEAGHGFHHMLTQIDYPAVSGINGVEWDAVELPSQFLENWCWEREALDLFARHHETGEALPEDLFAKMQAAKNFQSAMSTVRQLEFALFDFRLHQHYDAAKPADVMVVLNGVRTEVSVVLAPEFNRFPHAFGHIFAGGYAAGYYSYKWAEVLSADAFSAFEETGVFDEEMGRRFRREVLEVGGSRPAMESFKAFRGREPQLDALLRHSGIAA